MSEKEIIGRSQTPNTVGSLVRDLRALGIRDGDCLLVHSSLSRIGWICGGPQAVVQALLAAVGTGGTIVMPAHTGDWSDPAEWCNPPVPEAWLETIYREMPAFDPLLTPTRAMGRIAELFRTFPGTLRSAHPQVSFCANGKHAAAIVADHALTPQLGMPSPLGKLYGIAGAKVLLLGVGYDSCTSFHLAEALMPGMPVKRMGTAMVEDGSRTWKWFEDFAYDSEDFDRIGAWIEERNERGEHGVRGEGGAYEQPLRGKIGQADCRLLNLKAGVDAAGEWLRANRNSG